MTTQDELTEEERKILEKMHESIDYIIKTYKEYFDALAEFDRTGVLKIHGKILYVRKHNGTSPQGFEGSDK